MAVKFMLQLSAMHSVSLTVTTHALGLKMPDFSYFQGFPIVVMRRGGLGNQLFQYAAALQASRQNGGSVFFTPTQSVVHRSGPHLEDFFGPLESPNWRQMASFLLPPAHIQHDLVAWNRRIRRRLSIGRPFWIIEDGGMEQLELSYFGNAILFDAYFQSLSCVRNVLSEVAERILLKMPPLAIPRDDLISIHLRCGHDFASSLGKIPFAYYESALETFDPDRKAKLCVVGDIPSSLIEAGRRFNQLGWATEQSCVFTGERTMDDFWNLARARRTVISASTFAWWAAVVGDSLWNVDRHEVAMPDPWLPAKRTPLLRREHWRSVAYA